MNKEKAQINETKRVLIGKATTMQNMEMYTPCSLFLYGMEGLTQKLLTNTKSEITVILCSYLRLVITLFLFLILTAAFEVLVY